MTDGSAILGPTYDDYVVDPKGRTIDSLWHGTRSDTWTYFGAFDFNRKFIVHSCIRAARMHGDTGHNEIHRPLGPKGAIMECDRRHSKIKGACNSRAPFPLLLGTYWMCRARRLTMSVDNPKLTLATWARAAYRMRTCTIGDATIDIRRYVAARSRGISVSTSPDFMAATVGRSTEI